MLKIKDILDKKVVYSEKLNKNDRREENYEYRIIVQYDEKYYILFLVSEYFGDNSWVFGGYIPFAIKCVNKEFISESEFFIDCFDKKRVLKLNLESKTTLKDEEDFKHINCKEWLDKEVILLEYKDIKDFVKID